MGRSYFDAGAPFSGNKMAYKKPSRRDRGGGKEVGGKKTSEGRGRAVGHRHHKHPKHPVVATARWWEESASPRQRDLFPPRPGHLPRARETLVRKDHTESASSPGEPGNPCLPGTARSVGGMHQERFIFDPDSERQILAPLQVARSTIDGAWSATALSGRRGKREKGEKAP